MTEEIIENKETEQSTTEDQPSKEADPDFTEVLRDLIKRGLRVYYTNEHDFESFVTMTRGFGMNAEAFTRLFDIIVFQNGTLMEIEGFTNDQLIVANTLFMMGRWFKPKQSVYLRIKDGKKVDE